MKRLHLVLWTTICVIAVPQAAIGQTRPDRAVFVNGTLDLATSFGERGAPEVNQLIRGDSPFDNLRLRVFVDVAIHPRLTLFNQYLFDPSIRFGAESFLRSYLRYTVFRTAKADLHIQAGKAPAPFGTFAARSYSDKNPLVSTPLMYHYFSSLRTNQLPANNRDLLLHRGQGQADAFLAPGFKGGGAFVRINGSPMIYDACWDVGVAAIGSVWRVEYAAAVTQGALSSPRFKGGDNNDGKQVAGRLGFIPLTGLMIGVSYARGPYLDSAVKDSVRARGAKVEDFHQEIVGADLEYSIRHFKMIGEFAANRWEVPKITDGRGQRANLANYGGYLEGKYAFWFGLYGAVRYDRVAFGKIDDGTGAGTMVAWDDDLRLWEWGLGYYLTDGVIGKVIRQDYRYTRPGASNESFWAIQVSASF